MGCTTTARRPGGAGLRRRRRLSSRRLPGLLAAMALVAGLTGCTVGGFPPASAARAPASSPAGSATTPAPRSSSPTPASPRTWRVVALGDSVTAGTACGCTPFPELYAVALQDRNHRRVVLDNRGEPGETSADVLDDLAGNGAPVLARSDVVLVTIGANDFAGVADQVLEGGCTAGGDDLACARPGLATLRAHLAGLTTRVRELRGGAPTAVLLTGYWNVYEDGDVADRDYPRGGQQRSDELTRAVNGVVAAAASAGGGTYVDLYSPFKGSAGDGDPTDLLAADGDHPDAAGHRLIAATLLQAGTHPLADR